MRIFADEQVILAFNVEKRDIPVFFVISTVMYIGTLLQK